jgi:predicted ATPase
MALKFRKDTSKRITGAGSEPNVVYLLLSNWDDYSFKTTFHATFFDSSGIAPVLGEVKIGCVGQPHGWTAELMENEFPCLPEAFFSLGQSAEYYSALRALPAPYREEILHALHDVVRFDDALARAMKEDVFKTSLLRGVNYASITEQFKRIIDGGAVRTEFHFGYRTGQKDGHAEFVLTFDVHPNVKPSQNIHVLIGRNGIGKTTLLNGMIASLTNEREHVDGAGYFYDLAARPAPTVIGDGYFPGVVSVSFSAFDPFNPPPDRNGDASSLKYSYIGLKEVYMDGKVRKSKHKDLPDLGKDFISSLMGCFGLSLKREQWLAAIRFLESDMNFQEMDLARLVEVNDQEELKKRAVKVFLKMSSGHAIVLLTITRLIEKAEEKTLVLMDEPESHLHPPLLAAFTRALADLLHKINGVAIIATHSPVVLQEVPKSCVWKMRRTRLSAQINRPELETFGENVGTLTRDVFGLEVTKSGFHGILSRSVEEGRTFEQIVHEFGGQIGFEGRALLMSLVMERDSLRMPN